MLYEAACSIMLVDDHPIIHDALKGLMDADPDLDLQVGAFSAKEAMKVLKGGLPDLVIVDLSLGDVDGIRLIQRIKARHPDAQILVYTMSEEMLFAERAAMVGALGYVMKTSPPSMLKEAIRTIRAGGIYFSPEIDKRIRKRMAGRGPGYKSLLDNLSNREMDVFRLVGQGFDANAISAKLNISRNTVDTHRINIKNKLDLPSGKALDRYAYEVIYRGRRP